MRLSELKPGSYEISEPSRSLKLSELKPDSYKFSDNEAKPKQTAAAALEGFGEGATLGYLNNLQALADKPITAIGNFLTGNNVEADDYLTARDNYNRRQAELQRENPAAFGTGQIAGTIASSMPVAKAAQGATVAARALQGAKAGAIYGGLQNTQEREGELGGLDLPERIENAGVGMLMGGGASLAGDAIAKGIQTGINATRGARQKIGSNLKDLGEKMAFKSSGAMLRDFRSASDKKEINEIGRWMLDKGIIKAGDSVDDIAAKTAAIKQQAGEAIDLIYTNAENSLKSAMSQKGFDPLRDKNRIMAAAREELGDTVGAEAALNKLSNYLDDIAAKHGDKPYQQAVKQFSKEKQKFIQDAKQYRKDLREYRRQVGNAADDIDQELLPAFADDFQRTGQKNVDVELNGKPASNMYEEPYEVWTQQDLVSLPQFSKGRFNAPSGDDLTPLAQQMELDSIYRRELPGGYQSEILGAQVTPRTFGSGPVPSVNSSQGQMQFAIKPNRPVRPKAPEDIRNAMSPRRANEIKGALDDEINYARNPLAKEPAAEKAFSGARRELNKIVSDSIEELGGSSEAQALKAANKEYGNASRVNRMANDRVNRESANKMFGLTDTIAAGASTTYGAVTGDWQNAVLGFAGKKAIEKYGVTGLAVMADKASKALFNKSPQMANLAQTNPNAFRAAVFSLVERQADRLNVAGNAIPKAAENDKPQKGPEKWARDGVKRLIDAGVDQESAEALLKTKEGRSLLFDASDAPKDSARMQSVLRRIKSASTNGGE